MKEEVKQDISSLNQIKEINNDSLNKNLAEIEKQIAKCTTMVKDGKFLIYRYI